MQWAGTVLVFGSLYYKTLAASFGLPLLFLFCFYLLFLFFPAFVPISSFLSPCCALARSQTHAKGVSTNTCKGVSLWWRCVGEARTVECYTVESCSAVCRVLRCHSHKCCAALARTTCPTCVSCVATHVWMRECVDGSRRQGRRQERQEPPQHLRACCDTREAASRSVPLPLLLFPLLLLPFLLLPLCVLPLGVLVFLHNEVMMLSSLDVLLVRVQGTTHNTITPPITPRQ